jgi:hypothetical protein
VGALPGGEPHDGRQPPPRAGDVHTRPGQVHGIDRQGEARGLPTSTRMSVGWFINMGYIPPERAGKWTMLEKSLPRNYRGGFFRKTNNVVTNKEIQIVRPHSQQKIVYNMKRNDGPKKRCRTIDSESNDYTNTILIHCVLLVVVLIKDINGQGHS